MVYAIKKNHSLYDRILVEEIYWGSMKDIYEEVNLFLDPIYVKQLSTLCERNKTYPQKSVWKYTNKEKEMHLLIPFSRLSINPSEQMISSVA